MMLFNSHDKFCEFVGEQLKKKDHIDTAFVLMKSGIDEGDLLNAEWTIEILENHNGDYEWLNDYYEGQQFYEVAAVLLADEVADIIMDHLFFHIGG